MIHTLNAANAELQSLKASTKDLTRPGADVTQRPKRIVKDLT